MVTSVIVSRYLVKYQQQNCKGVDCFRKTKRVNKEAEFKVYLSTINTVGQQKRY